MNYESLPTFKLWGGEGHLKLGYFYGTEQTGLGKIWEKGGVKVAMKHCGGAGLPPAGEGGIENFLWVWLGQGAPSGRDKAGGDG